MNASKLISVLRNHSAGCDGCGHEHNCNHSNCALMLQAAGALESLLAEAKQLKTEKEHFEKALELACNSIRGCPSAHEMSESVFQNNTDTFILKSAFVLQAKEKEAKS